MAAQFSIEMYNTGDMEKSASTARDEVASIMRRIYDENPSYWPYGLDIPGHTDVYLVRDNMTKAACGFVGWQEQTRNGKKIGSYTIGILPEYRNNGYARAAVAEVLDKKASSCDEVCAYVMEHNKASKALADSLHVDVRNVPGVEKTAGSWLGKALIGGAIMAPSALAAAGAYLGAASKKKDIQNAEAIRQQTLAEVNGMDLLDRLKFLFTSEVPGTITGANGAPANDIPKTYVQETEALGNTRTRIPRPRYGGSAF